jgi:endonuclease YncB( thermonuclease family)
MAAMIWVLVLLLCAAPASAARVIDCHDGDTCQVVLDDGQVADVRLYGVDAPELRQPGGEAARAALLRLTRPGDISVTAVTRDRYGRLVARLRGMSGDVSGAMVRDGHAWVDPRYCTAAECVVWIQWQDAARAAGRGLWAGPAVPPWEWRAAVRRGRAP